MADNPNRGDEQPRRPGEGRPDMNDIEEERIRGGGEDIRGISDDADEEFEEDEDLEQEDEDEDEGAL